ncbi:MAG: DNA repair protein RadA [Treponema sp.]|nr:DNA repair protein RadA [Treponema sp.]
MDHVLGGGMTTGSIVLNVASAGTGKTTFASQIGAFQVMYGRRVYFFTGEETQELVKARAARLGILDSQPEMFFGKDMKALAETIRAAPPDMIIVDSIQTLLGKQMYRLTYEAQAGIMIQLRKLADAYNLVSWLIGHVRKDQKFAGPETLAHLADVVVEARKGLNDEVIFTTPTKNRFGSTGNRAVFRMTEKGLVEQTEEETGYILRHAMPSTVGLAAYVANSHLGMTVDEITVTNNEKDNLLFAGGSQSQAAFLSSVILACFGGFQPSHIVRTSLAEKVSKDADLAVVMAVLSKFYDKPLPRDVAFAASLDAFGRLLPLPDMAAMAKRAKDQGYLRVFGAVPIGSQTATWEVADNIREVWQKLGF